MSEMEMVHFYLAIQRHVAELDSRANEIGFFDDRINQNQNLDTVGQVGTLALIAIHTIYIN
jgi:hypothetical protein